MNKLSMSKLNQIRTKVDHLEFYKEHNISPVRQNITDLSRHFDRRGSLYRYLGLPKMFFKGKDILEVGPGSGHNSLYVASCLPKSYDLLEPNPTGQEGIHQLYNEFAIKHTSPSLIKQRLEDFMPEKLYDVVISECWLGISPHERKMMKKLGALLKPGGILITTLASPIGSVANAFRRLLSYRLTQSIESIEEKTEILVKAFGLHLGTMQDMTRPYEDWVQDCMINPGFMTISITPKMFMEDMGIDFEIYNSYPRFDTDWRWYKSLYGESKAFNERYMESYYRCSHNFYDYNNLFSQREFSKNLILEEYCLSLLSLIIDMEENRNKDYFNELTSIIKEIQQNLADVSTDWVRSIDEFLNLFQKEKVTVEQVVKMDKLKPIFGRELIYVSAIKGV
jgi:2-polyprenyl-3-methyl-5-hydroxy-6-metoxy-1,4-benzoquinol methylase